MGNVVDLFKKITLEDAKNIIIDNLKNVHHCKQVNAMCAFRGIDDFSLADEAIHSLIGESVVRVDRIPLRDKFGREFHAPLYRMAITDHLTY